MYAGVSNRPIALIVTENVLKMDLIMEEISGIVSSGDMPHLFSPKDFEEIFASGRMEIQRLQIENTKANLYALFLKRVRNNLHVVINAAPHSEQLSSLLRLFPNLVNCCTVKFIGTWPEAAL